MISETHDRPAELRLADPHPRAGRRRARVGHRHAGVGRELRRHRGYWPADEKPPFWHSGFAESFPYRRGLRRMPILRVIVRIVKHTVNTGEKYGKLTIIAEVRKVAPSGRSYRAVLCRCDCGNELTPALRSLMSGDARSCGCSRGRPKYEWKRCSVCGRLVRIRRDRRSCSRTCGHELTGAGRTLLSGLGHLFGHRQGGGGGLTDPPSLVVYGTRVSPRGLFVAIAERHPRRVGTSSWPSFRLVPLNPCQGRGHARLRVCGCQAVNRSRPPCSHGQA
jgi:hypothetical protein